MSSSQQISRILQRDRVIAVVGLSTNEQRPSNEVAAYLQARGLRIVPVNPAYAGNGGKVLGETCYPDLASAARALAAEGSAIDLVDVFRRPEEVVDIARDAVAIGAKTLWLQLGVINEEAAAIAAAAGLDVVMDHCLKIEYARLAPGGALPS
jgi:predicted CoA-binding protein